MATACENAEQEFLASPESAQRRFSVSSCHWVSAQAPDLDRDEDGCRPAPKRNSSWLSRGIKCFAG